MKLYKKHGRFQDYDVELNAMEFMVNINSDQIIKINQSWPNNANARSHNNVDKDIFGKNYFKMPFLFKVFNK